MKLTLALATARDAPLIAGLRNAVANDLTARYGKGHWSHQTTEKGILFGMKGNSKLIIARRGRSMVGTLLLTTKKPWAIDPAYFTKIAQPVYLVAMAVRPDLQRNGIGKYMMEETYAIVKKWPAQAIRLDAYDTDGGAGEFYRKCGFTEKGRVIYKKVPLIYFEWLT